MISVAIIDVIGLTYDGTTLSKRGLGGSESAIILLSKELAKQGFDVTVINNCLDNHCSPGTYDGVTYIDMSSLFVNDDYTFDVIISSRTVMPFITDKDMGGFNYPLQGFQKMKKRAKLRAIWLHDTFCSGDHLLEELLVGGDVHEIFTLSDFHTSYVTNCDHGGKRMFEVIKNKVFMTRNGAVNYRSFVDITKKDQNLFVYNSSVSKGMIPLVEKIWPLIKQRIPEAKLKIIGGFYRFRDGSEPDEQEKSFWKLHDNPNNQNLGITFTGIIKQSEIADILCDASFMLYPTAFPETFGISALESLLYNTPIITCRFGAMEETAINNSAYFIDYPIEPNGLFPRVNQDKQVNDFVEMAVHAHQDVYLRQQKMYNCNSIKGYVGWDSVALQWKQHLYRKLGQFLPINDFTKVHKINLKIHHLFGRRFSNPEEWVEPKNVEEEIFIITPFYNAREYISLCILSVASQNYDNYQHVLIDDASTDDSYEIAKATIESLPFYLQKKFILSQNDANMGALYNQYRSLYRCKNSKAITMLLDGDDWIYPRSDIFDIYNNMYNEGVDFTYGSCHSLADNIPLIAQPYPPEVIKNKSYRDYKFSWGIPYTHLRTFKNRLSQNINVVNLKDEMGGWRRAGGDVALFYELIKSANNIKAVTDITCVYNDKNPINDYKVNKEEQTMNAANYLKEYKGSIAVANNETPMLPFTPPETKRILLAIPTAKNVETQTFKSIYDLEIPNDCEIDLQFFYGYNIDQVRNLIAHWACNYDYLFSVDSDIILPKDALVKMLKHNVDMVSGLYIQRKPGQHILEIYVPTTNGGTTNAKYDEIKNYGTFKIAGCGFGCVLIKSEVIRKIGYPQFVYKSAIDHKDTISEDTYFCNKAIENGFKIYADTSILCDHVGSTTFEV